MAKYWVGGSGNWTDNTNHWSDSDGGSPGAVLPGTGDNVIFNSNSHTTAYTVTLNAAASCADMTWGLSGDSTAPTLTGTSSYNLSIYGNCTFVAGMTNSSFGWMSFLKSSGTQTLTTNSVVLNKVRTGNATLQLVDNLTVVYGIDKAGGGDLDATTYSRSVTMSGMATGNTLTMGGFTFYDFTFTGAAGKTETLPLGGNITVTRNLTINGNSATNRLLLSSTVIGTTRTITCGNTKTFSNFDIKDITWNSTNARTISSAASDGGTGTRFLTAAAHGLIAGDTVVIAGTTNYNGSVAVTNVSDTTHFDIATAYVSDQAGTWTLDISAITGASGNCGGNTGFTFTAAANQVWVHGGNNTVNWSLTTNWRPSSETLGSESLTNGDLTGGTSWTATADCSLTGDAAVFSYSAGTSSRLRQANATLAVAPVNSAIYKLTYTVSAVSGTPTATINASAFADNTTYLDISNGSKTLYFIAHSSASSQNFDILSTLTAGQAFTLDSLSLKQVTSTGRVPLPQDTAVFDSTSFAYTGKTVTQDMPRIGSVSWENALNTPTWTTSTVASCFGSITLISGMTLTGSNQTYTLEGRSSYTLTMAGKSWAKIVNLNAPGGTYTLQDAYTSSTGLGIDQGTITATGNVTCNNVSYQTTTSGTCTVNLGSGTWTITGTGAGSAWKLTTGVTIGSITNNTIKFTDTSATTKTFTGRSKTYNNIWYAPGAGTGEFDLADGNTFSDFKDDGTAAHSVKFSKSTTTNVASWNVGTSAVRGSNVNVITLDTVDGAGTFTLHCTGINTVCDYLSISRSTVDSSPKWFAGGHSTNTTGNTNWIFSGGPGNILVGGKLVGGKAVGSALIGR